MPEKYMALNSMGIGFSGLISVLLYALLLSIYGTGDDDSEFERIMIFYTMQFLIMTLSACMYFFERKSD